MPPSVFLLGQYLLAMYDLQIVFFTYGVTSDVTYHQGVLNSQECQIAKGHFLLCKLFGSELQNHISDHLVKNISPEYEKCTVYKT